MRKTVLAVVLACTAAAAFAHGGVKNAAVLARMEGMKSIGDAMKVLGTMAKGQAPFAADPAQQAAATIARHAAQTPALFKAPETDPKSEARARIWKDFQDFTEQAMAMEQAAIRAQSLLVSKTGLKPAVQSIGATCKSCHELYRK
ncbi:c-type cytochrome [Antarctobacter jejuensis]|uniref:c-type cytochrome n=1 Tax=Antarctobacter jejuensis TaxID=1439938 RepID=UPI003FD4F932